MEIKNLKLSLPWNLRYVLSVIGLLLSLNLVLRVAFLLFNQAQAHSLGWNYLFTAFMVGIRFDLATIFIFNGLIFLLVLVPSGLHKRRKTFLVANTLILLVNLPVIFVNGVDVVYFGFSEKRLTHEFSSTRLNDLLHFPLGELALQYWYVLVLMGLVLVFLVLALRYILRLSMQSLERADESGSLKFWAFAVLAIGLMFTGIRGGLQPLPLRPSNAFVTPNLFAGNLGLNSAYTMITSMTLNQDLKVDYVAEKDAIGIIRSMVRNDFDIEFGSERFPFLRRAEFRGSEKRYNVVLIVVESLNADNIGRLKGKKPEESITPNFDRISKKGRLFSRYYANANRSVEALPGILNSIPELYTRPLIGSDFETINHWGIGNMLLARGYETSFFHGGRNGTMGFDNYTRISGLNRYYGFNEYPNSEKDGDGGWGVFDGPFMQNWAIEIDKMKAPFFTSIFTLSNHHPFTLPDEGFEDLANRKDLSPFQKTTAYTDHCIGAFFDQIKDKSWYDSTLFLITADHTFFESSDPNRTICDFSHIPLLLLGPGIEPGVDNRLANQISILPTLIELLRLDTWHASSSVSLLQDPGKSFVITNQMGVRTLMKNDLALSTSFEKVHGAFVFQDQRWVHESGVALVSPEKKEEMDYELRCLFQLLRDSRTENRLIGSEYLRF